MACRLYLLVVMVSVSVVWCSSDILLGERNQLVVAGVGDEPLWSAIVEQSKIIFLGLADELFRYVIRAVAYFLGIKAVIALFEGTFYVADRVIALVFSMLEVPVAVLESGSFGMIRNIFDVLRIYLHPTRTGITWLGEATLSISSAALEEFKNYIGAMIASAGYVGAAYGLIYMDHPSAENNTDKALKAVMYYIPPRGALSAIRFVLSTLLRPIITLF